MFKKFKDKLAEEVKSSPQRIQQFAQAAQAAVTSASSSISDITSNDLFSIGDNDTSSKSHNSSSQQNNLQEVPLPHTGNVETSIQPVDHHLTQEMSQESNRQRKLSESSLASDISFRLPSYESPSMYHLQSDMEVSASEAEDRGLPGGTVNLDRVTKEQLYSAYRRTQDRCTKYKTQYADLARHYKLLERENAKARNVLVETQDKALRRISELREQCSLEQSAKAHLEKALQMDIEEKNMKIQALNTKLSLLQSTDAPEDNNLKDKKLIISDGNENDAPLITLATDNVTLEKSASEDPLSLEVTTLNNKVDKMEQLLNKYKDSLKTAKEKNAQITAELQKISNELDFKVKENNQLKASTASLLEARKKIEELNEKIEELENKNNTAEFLKSKEMSILEVNLKNAKEEILQLRKKIEVLSKREEEYAISLAENKLSIHKELEGKESEIKSLKESLQASQNEIQSLNIIINDYKSKINQLEEENTKLRNDINELNTDKAKIVEVKTELETFAQKCQHLESLINKSDEEYKCLELQMKQENAEKLAMIDRNVYLENRNAQLKEENSKKNTQITQLENELHSLKNNDLEESMEIKKYITEVNEWKEKCSNLESEIQDERVELVKLQSEIEKLLANHESVQSCNETLNITVKKLEAEIINLKNNVQDSERLKLNCEDLRSKVVTLRNIIDTTTNEFNTLKQFVNGSIKTLKDKIILLSETATQDFTSIVEMSEDLQRDNQALQNEVNKISDQCLRAKNELTEKENELQVLKTNIEQLHADKVLHLQEIKDLRNKFQNSQCEIKHLTEESDIINEKLRNCNDEKLNIKERNDYLTKENEKLLKMEESITVEKEMLKEEINKVSLMYKEMLDNFEVLSKERDDLLVLNEANVKKLKEIDDLKQRLQELQHENTSLKNLSDTFSKSVSDIELELKEVQKSHSQIEIEKDHLISVIDNLEKNTTESRQSDGKTTQTDLIGSNINEEIMESHKTIKALQEDIKLLKDANVQLSSENEHNMLTIKKNDDTLKQRDDAFDKLKEDNRRLQSDIEGLQTHITKVSKENSQLNDKLRELIATTESIPEKSDILSLELESLKNEIQTGKDKIENLLRENSFLAEENLELKDQIHSQTYSQSSTTDSLSNSNVENMMDKYNILLDTKNNLEKKVRELELMNQSITGNMQVVQANNDKLKLSNEKLGLRLDEALVSLRHLHSLQENTELEYLKNILYEYLTGTGAHSITLAKVLAAVVKFDDRQTELVLQKEKERQGLLRQLGII